MARRRDDDDRDDDDRLRRRKRDDDDEDDRDDDDRPRSRRRRSRDEDDDLADRPRRKQLSGLDSTFADTSIPILIIFGFCCGWIAVLLSVIALVTCRDETAKRNALIVLVVAGVMALFHTAFAIMQSAGPGRF